MGKSACSGSRLHIYIRYCTTVWIVYFPLPYNRTFWWVGLVYLNFVFCETGSTNISIYICHRDEKNMWLTSTTTTTTTTIYSCGWNPIRRKKTAVIWIRTIIVVRVLFYSLLLLFWDYFFFLFFVRYSAPYTRDGIGTYHRDHINTPKQRGLVHRASGGNQAVK